jgi:hypothetical protein
VSVGPDGRFFLQMRVRVNYISVAFVPVRFLMKYAVG